MDRIEIEGFVNTARGAGYDIRRNGNPKGLKVSKFFMGDDGEWHEDIDAFVKTMEAAEKALVKVGMDITASIMNF